MVGKMRKIKRKHWLDAHSRKILRDRTKSNRKRRSSTKSGTLSEKLPERHILDNRNCILTAPPILSVFENTKVTLEFFHIVMDTFQHCAPNQKVFFDLHKVESITVDAIIYLIALIKNTKKIRAYKIQCRGNMPDKAEVRKLIEQSGFYNHLHSVASHKQLFYDKHNYLKISSGRDADGKLAGTICDFTQSLTNGNLLTTKRLYPMVVELMTNTHQHAYTGENSVMNNFWYIFAQNKNDKVQFVFLDTGLGIPKTISKKLGEKIKDLFKDDDATYLQSVLKGDFRTETKQDNRGKGIPGIYEDVCKHILTDFQVISGKGLCKVAPSGEIVKTELDNSFEGTMFMWTIPKYKEDIIS